MNKLKKIYVTLLTSVVFSMTATLQASEKTSIQLEIQEGIDYDCLGSQRYVRFLPSKLDSGKVVKYAFQEIEGSLCLKVTQEENKLLKANDFDNNKKIELVTQNTIKNQSIYCDITNFPELTLENTVHKIHDNGYHHDANKHVFEDVTFYFTNSSAGVGILPKSELSNNNFELSNLLSNFIQNNSSKLPSSKVNNACCINSIFIEPLQKNGSSSGVVSGTIEFGDKFSMELYAQNLKLTFYVNDNFSLLDEDREKLF